MHFLCKHDNSAYVRFMAEGVHEDFYTIAVFEKIDYEWKRISSRVMPVKESREYWNYVATLGFKKVGAAYILLMLKSKALA